MSAISGIGQPGVLLSSSADTCRTFAAELLALTLCLRIVEKQNLTGEGV